MFSLKIDSTAIIIMNKTIIIDNTIPIAPVIIPAIAIFLLADLIVIAPNTIAKIPHGNDICHTHDNTSATIPNIKDTLARSLLLFSSLGGISFSFGSGFFFSS